MELSSNHEATTNIARDINLLSDFLSNSQLSFLSSTTPVSVPTGAASAFQKASLAPSTVIVAASAILHQAHAVFSFFQTQLPTTVTDPSSITTLVLTGGIGHSTTHLYNAVLVHPTYSALPTRLGLLNHDLTGRSEADLFYLIFVHFYDGETVSRQWNGSRGLKVLVESKSTNCGANAVMSRALLEQNMLSLGNTSSSAGMVTVDDAIVVQDPTMSLRTKATFEKVYKAEIERDNLRFWTWPTFVPRVTVDEQGEIVWDGDALREVDTRGLWDMKRFYGLILGEIPRLRDDAGGYGPRGKGFIVHVHIPHEINDAWTRLSSSLDFER